MYVTRVTVLCDVDDVPKRVKSAADAAGNSKYYWLPVRCITDSYADMGIRQPDSGVKI